jgi:hypothetical protein
VQVCRYLYRYLWSNLAGMLSPAMRVASLEYRMKALEKF